MKRINYIIRAIIGILIMALIGCSNKNRQLLVQASSDLPIKQILKDSELINWYLKDIVHDTLPGLSIERLFQEKLKNEKGKDVIIAVIDGEVDVTHPKLTSFLWRNKKEIPNNSIDDDFNGYADDINGWNFIGNLKGETQIYMNYDKTRIVKKYEYLFDSVSEIDSLTTRNKQLVKLYERANKSLEEEINTSEQIHANAIKIIADYKVALEKLSPYVLEKDFTKEKLDSLLAIYPDLNEEIRLSKKVLSFGQNMVDIKNVLNFHKDQLKYYLNKEYNDRTIIGDNSDDLTDIGYGNNLLSNNKKKLFHGTLVAGVLESIVNFSGENNIKIMPLCVSGYGDEHDKDISLAIRYAVDNGANIINISSGKDFSLYEEWVQDAIKYAERNDVLIVTSAGNASKDLDATNSHDFPNDTDYNGKEIVSNFIKVGASGYSLDENIYATFSNYGQNEVDIFAPGVNIYTTSATNESGFEFTEGTSVAAPMVSGIAALLKSYYPHLTAKELKEIILQSGVTYKNCVTVLDSNGEKETIPFNLLSKSGKIVNAYNAFVLAARIR